MSEILQCLNVSKHFGSIAAVDDISFDVNKGEILGIAGPNGAGKTTLFNLITGVYHPEGEIKFQGKSVSGMEAHQICHRGIARTFQVPQLFDTLSAYDNVRVGAVFGSEDGNVHKRICEVMEFVGMTENINTTADTLSLMDKKRVMIAAALATKPKLLLLDEPIAGLNPAETRESVDLFKKINSALGVTIIIIEHFMKVLIELSERLMIIENGRHVCIGNPVDVTSDKRVIECYLGESYA